MPRDEPVITATLPCSENSDAIERLQIVGRATRRAPATLANAPCAGKLYFRNTPVDVDYAL